MLGRGDSRLRRIGLTAFGILLVAFALASILVWRYHLGMGGEVSSAVADGAALSALYLAWVVVKNNPADATLDATSRRLAQRVEAQWKEGTSDRELTFPYLLPVSWISKSSVEDLSALRRMALNAAGSFREPAGKWAERPEELAGTGPQIAEVLGRVPTGRLVVLGEPGAGKTVLMIRLVLDLLSTRQPDEPVPVLCPVASWNPVSTRLHDWLAGMLIMDHPFLAAEAPPGVRGKNCAQALLGNGRIMPILDGLDEIPDDVRAHAIAGINRTHSYPDKLVVTCRTEEFMHATKPERGQAVDLHGAAVAELCPLEIHDVFRYLEDSAQSSLARNSWKVVEKKSKDYPAFRCMLESPLMAGLARAVCNSEPGEIPIGESVDPERLIESPDPGRYLLQAFIPAVYRSNLNRHWTAAKAERWLRFIAIHLQRKIKMPDFKWWELPKSIPHAITETTARISKGVAFGPFSCIFFSLATAAAAGVAVAVRIDPADGYLASLAVGLTVCLSGASSDLLPGGHAAWAAVGLAAGLSGALIGGEVGGIDAGLATALFYSVAVKLAWRQSEDPTRSIKVLPIVFLNYCTIAAVSWFVAGALSGGLISIASIFLFSVQFYLRESMDSFSSELLSGVAGGLSGGAMAAILSNVPLGIMVGISIFLVLTSSAIGHALEGRSITLLLGHSTTRMTPPVNLSLARQTVLLQSCGVAFGSGLVAGMAVGELIGITAGVMAGVTEGIAVGVFCCAIDPKWPCYVVARVWLAFNRELPWRLMAFLVDARHRDVLRQVGAMYEFRHMAVQHELAAEFTSHHDGITDWNWDDAQI